MDEQGATPLSSDLKEHALILSMPGAATCLLIGWIVAFFGWLAIMLHRAEPEHTARSVVSGGWTLLIAGLTIAVCSIARIL